MPAGDTDRSGTAGRGQAGGSRARELSDALLVNPYAVDEFAAALRRALTMPAEEQEHRMRRLRARVEEHHIYRWAGLLLSEAGGLVGAGPGGHTGDRDGRAKAGEFRVMQTAAV